MVNMVNGIDGGIIRVDEWLEWLIGGFEGSIGG